jgi:uncharacterized membrane protein
MFEEIGAEEETAEATAVEKPAAESALKRWRCTICGYIHDGPAPPPKCPVCGVGADMFEELVNEETAVEPAVSAALPKDSPYDKLCDLLTGLHAHPISVHVPNGILPAVVLFILIALLYGSQSFSQAAFFNTAFVLMAMPFVVYSGVVTWKRKYKGVVSSTFKIKIICSAIVGITSLTSVLWMEADPQILVRSGFGRYLFLLINIVLLAATGLAGHLGGKLVFKD